jgi:hypothetical protein
MLQQRRPVLWSCAVRRALGNRYPAKTERDMICVLPAKVKAKNATNGGKSVGKSTENNRNSQP